MEITFQSRLALRKAPEELFSQTILPEYTFFFIRMLIQEDERKK